MWRQLPSYRHRCAAALLLLPQTTFITKISLSDSDVSQLIRVDASHSSLPDYQTSLGNALRLSSDVLDLIRVFLLYVVEAVGSLSPDIIYLFIVKSYT